MRIVKYPNNKLSKPCIDVSKVDAGKVASKLIMRTINQRKGACGFAANQVGMKERIFTALIYGKWKVFINPVIFSKSATTFLSTESCLSIPGKEYNVMRHDAIVLKYIDINGKKRTDGFRDFNAVVIQHEVDHLNGITIADEGELI
jgi:peptide deformylase